MAVQVNGKLRAQLELPKGIDQASAFAAARQNANVQKFIDGKTVVREVFVPNRLLGFVVK